MTWQDEHDDPNTEPYMVIHIRNAGEIMYRAVEQEDGTYDVVNVPGGTYNFHVFYRTYNRRTWLSVEGRDELEAFMRADKILTRRKRGADKRLKNKTTTSGICQMQPRSKTS
jgi:hypothetical protein